MASAQAGEQGEEGDRRVEIQDGNQARRAGEALRDLLRVRLGGSERVR